LEPDSRTHYLFGTKISTKRNDKKDIATMELQFIYLDSDLCIIMIGGDSGILNVYTKNEEWRESRNNRVSQCICIFYCIVFHLVSFLFDII
jgi:hypothetical protein